MEAALTVAIVAVALLIAWGMLLLRAPAAVESMVKRTKRFEIKRVLAAEFFTEAIDEKEHREPDPAEVRKSVARIPPGRILWVDDTPANNRLEVQALREVEVEVDAVTSNFEAESYLAARDYDLVLSDIGRPGDAEAGLNLPAVIEDRRPGTSLAFYVSKRTGPTAPGGQPVLTTPTELISFVTDTLLQPKREHEVRR